MADRVGRYTSVSIISRYSYHTVIILVQLVGIVIYQIIRFMIKKAIYRLSQDDIRIKLKNNFQSVAELVILNSLTKTIDYNKARTNSSACVTSHSIVYDKNAGQC